MKKFVCTVCGYIHEGETAPEVCPVCKVGAEKFEEMKSTVKPLMEQLLGNVNEENPIVVLRFCNSDGSVISEKEYDKTVLDESVSEN